MSIVDQGMMIGVASRQRPRRRHHVVSKFYLERFANQAHMLTRVPLGGGQPHLVAASRATMQVGYYEVDRPGVEKDAFEKMLSDLETPAADAFRRLIDYEVWPISADDRYVMASWIALQHLRSDSTRKGSEEVYRAVAKLEVGCSTTEQMRGRLGLDAGVPDEDVEGIRAAMLATADTFDVNHDGHLELIAEMLEGITNLVYFRRPWVVVRWSNLALGTSDTPLILMPSTGHGFYGGGSIGTASELLMPLGRNVALMMGAVGSDRQDYLGVPSQIIADRINQYTSLNARRELFHHPDDNPFRHLELPDRRSREMNTADAQINSLIASFAAQQGRQSGLPSDFELPTD